MPVEDCLSLYPDLLAAGLLRRVEDKIGRSIISPQTGAKYARTLAALESRVTSIPSQDISMLRDYATAMTKAFPDIPSATARPLPREILQALLRDTSLGVDFRAALFIAWKTASRWDDILDLSLPLILVSNFQLLVPFLANTKAAKAGALPFEPRFLCMVDWGSPKSTHPPTDVLKYLTTSEISLGKDWSTRKLEKFLGQIPTVREVFSGTIQGRAIRDNYTAHSIKKGAIRWLWQNHAAEHLNPLIIERISKHKNPNGEPLSAECVRYAPSLIPVALYLETHLASRLL